MSSITEPQSSKGSNVGKQFLLVICSLFIVLFCSKISVYNEWLNARIFKFYSIFRNEQFVDKTDEERKASYYGTSYKVCQMVKTNLAKLGETDKIVLVEPNEYIQKTAGFSMPEPVVFYYYTGGIQSVITTSPQVNKASYFLHISAKNMELLKIKSPQELQTILLKYKSYSNSL